MPLLERNNISVIAGRPDDDSYFETNNPYNDIWGLTDVDGIEYAIIGRADRIEIFDISTNSAEPDLVKTIYGRTGASERDIKVYRNHAYVVYDGRFVNYQGPQDLGMQIVDISNPSRASVVGTYTTDFHSCHNLFIADGFLYACEVDTYSTAKPMHILDLCNPTNPVLVGMYTAMEFHDIYVRGNVAYAAVFEHEGFSTNSNSGVLILDVSDKSNISEIGTINIPEGNTHSAWLSENGRYLFVTTEKIGGHVWVYDVYDPSIPLLVGNYPAGSKQVIHNVYIKGNYAYLSYYSEGIVVLDISVPSDPKEVASYYTFNYDDFVNRLLRTPNALPDLAQLGVYGLYPFYSSGKIAASEQGRGLYVFKVDQISELYISLPSFLRNRVLEISCKIKRIIHLIRSRILHLLRMG